MKNGEKDTLYKIRHTLAHVLAMAALEFDPKAKVAIGPPVDDGFYYDFEFSEGVSVGEENLKDLQKKMRKILSKGFEPEFREVSAQEAKTIFQNQPYKLELVRELEEKGSAITVYEIGEFVDLCEGPHVKTSKEIDQKAFKLSRIAGAYWRGDEKNKMLTRIYGYAFENKERLDEHLTMLEEAKKRDHKKLGKELELFTFSETVGKGLPLWTHKGATIRREIERFIVDEEIKRGYLHVMTPDMAKIELYEKSGHYPHYKDSMYPPIKIDDEEFMLRPMTCPHHFELYLSKPHSYKELPIRIAELAKLYRYEQSGELSGLIRVRGFCLADAHIICADEEQAINEVGNALDLIEYVAGVFGLKIGKDYWYRLSLGDKDNKDKYYQDDKAWEKSERMLREFLQNRGENFQEASDEAAFYGPKIDIQMRNVNGKEDTAFTVQYDFCMPERFNLKYLDKNGEERQPIVVHRSSVGALERIIAFLIEHYAGSFPVWLSPEQVRVLPIGEDHKEYAEKVFKSLKNLGIRAQIDASGETLGKKIRNVKIEKIPYFLVIGDEEVKNELVTVESRDNGKVGTQKLDEFAEFILSEIKDKK